MTYNGDPSDGYENTDWMSPMRRLTLMHQHNLSVSGGSEKARYFVSGGFRNQEGIIKGHEDSRGNLRSNVDLTPHDNLRVQLNVAASLQDYYQPGAYSYANQEGSEMAGEGRNRLSCLGISCFVVRRQPRIRFGPLRLQQVAQPPSGDLGQRRIFGSFREGSETGHVHQLGLPLLYGSYLLALLRSAGLYVPARFGHRSRSSEQVFARKCGQSDSGRQPLRGPFERPARGAASADLLCEQVRQARCGSPVPLRADDLYLGIDERRTPRFPRVRSSGAQFR